jgi:hypothetical protein
MLIRLRSRIKAISTFGETRLEGGSADDRPTVGYLLPLQAARSFSPFFTFIYKNRGFSGRSRRSSPFGARIDPTVFLTLISYGRSKTSSGQSRRRLQPKRPDCNMVALDQNPSPAICPDHHQGSLGRHWCHGLAVDYSSPHRASSGLVDYPVAVWRGSRTPNCIQNHYYLSYELLKQVPEALVKIDPHSFICKDF